MKYNFDFDKLRKKGTCIHFKNENEYNIFVDWYKNNINEVYIDDLINYYKNICLIFKPKLGGKFGHNEYDTYIKKNHPKIYTFDELLIKGENEMKENFKDYKQVKPISGKDIVNEACREEFEKFVKHFGFHNEIEFNNENFNWIRDNIENGIKFGIDYEFIEKVEKVEKVEKYDEKKLYFCTSNKLNEIGKLVKINNKYIWVDVNSITNNVFSNKYHNTIKDSIEYIINICWNVKEFDTFEEAMEYYFSNKNKIDDMPKTDKINLLYDLCKEFDINMVCGDINFKLCCGASCTQCKLNKK